MSGNNDGQGFRSRGAHACWKWLYNMLFVAAILPAQGVCLAAGIVPDGQTGTVVTTNPAGRQVVTIAAPRSGVSNNTYTSFDVGTPGATLDNTAANARMIVNQVTSTNPSLIEGDISVAGPRANVILANPNGITVNGGTFTNIGHMALATGTVEIPGTLNSQQPYITINTSGGVITVGSGGLAGTLIGLELIAKSIAINGPVTNQYSSPTAGVRLIGGSSQISVDTTLSPSDNNNDWLVIGNQTLSNPNAIAIDISALGSITSGHIQLIVTDQGAGVRHAGSIVANAGDFDIASNGTVEFTQGATAVAAGNMSVKAAGNVMVSGAQLTAGSAAFNSRGTVTFTGASLTASGGADVSAGAFVSQNDGAVESTIASTNGGVSISTVGDITNTSSLIQGAVRTAGDSLSLGAVTLNAGGDILNTSLPANAFGVLFGQNDDVSLVAAGNVTNHDGRILSNQNVTIAAQGDVTNSLDTTPGIAGSNQPLITSYADRSTRLLIFSHHDNGVYIDYGTVTDANEVPYISADAGSVSITGRNVSNAGGVIQSNDGNITIAAQQTVTNLGEFSGQASFNEWCFIVCHRSASSNIQAYGGQIQAGGDISLAAGTSISNIGGNVIAGNNLTLNAPTVTATGVPGYTSYNRDRSLKEWFGSSWAAIFSDDTGGLFDAASGVLTIAGEEVIDGGSFAGARGVTASRGVVTLRAPYHQPVTIDNPLGLVSFFGL
jgi:filamentous hemagglutinin family protein